MEKKSSKRKILKNSQTTSTRVRITRFYISISSQIFLNFSQTKSFLKLWRILIRPNLITLIGFIINFIPVHLYLLIAIGFGTKELITNWFNFVIVGCLFFYIVMDNCDGKQARKTGNSTPLGLLFDHGCDSISCGLITIIFAHLFGAETWQYLLVVMGVCFMFYFKTYEEYCTGEMVFGYISPVDEGLTALMLMAIVSFFLGNDFWR